MPHDKYNEHSYQQRCQCQKCTATYDKWCDEKKKAGCATCKRKCYTICEIVCEKPRKIVDHWGYKKRYDGPWKHYEEKSKSCSSSSSSSSSESHHKRRPRKHHNKNHGCNKCNKH